ncbi:MAG: dephospho-CoA kinase [Bacteroidales bacterium]|nr:dephospho-CoA kinase [Bacteroidales bacterium]
MITVGLTGGIGSGKSYIAKIFENLNIPVFNSDNQAKRAYLDPDIQAEVVQLLGADSIINGQPNTSFIAPKVFNNSVLLAKLNAIIHPWLGNQFRLWAESLSEHPYLIKEAAIIFETGIYQELNYTICVTAPEQTRIDRVKARDGSSEEDIVNRMMLQWPDEKKISLADYVIQNDAKQLLIPQVLKIHQTLISKS